MHRSRQCQCIYRHQQSFPWKGTEVTFIWSGCPQGQIKHGKEGGQAGISWAMGGQASGIILVSRLHLVSLGKASSQLLLAEKWAVRKLDLLAMSSSCVNIVTISSCVQHLLHTSPSLSQPLGFAYIFKKGLFMTMKVTWNRNGPASRASVYERVWN